MDRRRRPISTALAPIRDIPSEYLESVKVLAYHLDLNLAVEKAQFTGCVRIIVQISGPPRSDFYLHSALGLVLARATVGGTSATIVKYRLSLASVTKLEVPAEMAVYGRSVIEVDFSGSISTWRPEGISMLGHNHPAEESDFCDAVTGRGRLEDGPGLSDGGGGKGVGKNEEEPDKFHGSESATNTSRDAVEREPSGISYSTTTATSNTIRRQASAFPVGGVLGTHLEPTHARDLFPCVDLPSSKAVFYLTLRGVPRHLRAISNTPVLHVENEGDPTAVATAEGENGDSRTLLKTVAFQSTPIMSTYIFGFWVGDFHCLTTHAWATDTGRTTTLLCGGSLVSKPQTPSPLSNRPEENTVEISVHLPKTVDLQGARFCLDFARRAFELFSRLFSVPFPLPKLDLLGLAQMHGLGMENFGAITLLQEYMLVTAGTTFVRRRRIARLICHEVCHQWYGDIVTPQSFDELWLKEGLARFFEFVALDTLDPSYCVWTNFMSEVFFQAMLEDSQENSHPVVQQHNGDISSILQSFDVITYCKGASVLRMLYHCVGSARFLEGTRRFVVDHQYSCATQEDLWKAVQSVCDRDGVALNIRNLMRPWLTCAMFPVLHVRMSADNTLTITQQPFSFYGHSEGLESDDSGSDERQACDVADEGPERSCVRDASTSDILQKGAGDPVDSSGLATPFTTGEACSVKITAPETAMGGNNGPAGRRGDEGSADTLWVIPLRIRVAYGPRSVPRGGVADDGAKGEDAPFDHCTGGARPGEEMYSFLMTGRSDSVTLSCLSSDSINRARSEVGAGVAGEEKGEAATSAGGGRRSDPAVGERGQPYLVLNDGHSGFFTVQYECERSWSLALAALEDGVLNECETMGLVHDLVLGFLRQRFLTVRKKSTENINEGMCDGSFHCNVPRLVSRIQDVVRVLGRDRSHPAWCIGQLFIWKLLMMYAAKALKEMHVYWRRRQQDAMGSSHQPQRPKRGDSMSRSAPVVGEVDGGIRPPNDVQKIPPAETVAGDAPAFSTAAEGREKKWFVSDDEVAAAERVAFARLKKVTADMELAFEDSKEHVQWHSDRVASGVEKAAETLESLCAMRDRLGSCRAELMLCTTNFNAEI